MALLCLDYFFIAPLFSLRVAQPGRRDSGGCLPRNRAGHQPSDGQAAPGVQRGAGLERTTATSWSTPFQRWSRAPDRTAPPTSSISDAGVSGSYSGSRAGLGLDRAVTPSGGPGTLCGPVAQGSGERGADGGRSIGYGGPTGSTIGSGSGDPLRDAQGRIVNWYSCEYDIDERKRAEERARQADRELRNAIDTIPAMSGVRCRMARWTSSISGWLEYTGLRGGRARGSWMVVRASIRRSMRPSWRSGRAAIRDRGTLSRWRPASDGPMGNTAGSPAAAVPLRDEGGATSSSGTDQHRHRGPEAGRGESARSMPGCSTSPMTPSSCGTWTT